MAARVRVEFYGMARQQAGLESIEVRAETLQDVLRCLADRLPAFADVCLDRSDPLQRVDRPPEGGHDEHYKPALNSGYLANINGRTFTSDPSTPLSDGDCVLILSADVGG